MSAVIFNTEGRLPADSKTNKYTINFCNKTTWYYESERVVLETLSANQDYTEYSTAYANMIDLCHGKVTDEHTLIGNESTGYGTYVYFNDVLKTETTPFGAGTDGDYSVNYATGKIIPHSALTSEDVVKATYSYENGSELIIAPASGKVLSLIRAELQMSADVVLNDTVKYQITGLGQYFGGPTDVRIPLLTRKYKTMQDILNESNGVYPQFPALGGSPRGTTQITYTLKWDYITRSEIHDAYGMQLEICLENDSVFGGAAGVVTFYFTSTDA
ncbi:MAG: hypothetical protein ACXAEU_19800 [Candidatus Hodarchaeales archaeon]|jgi:hypothetical protein